MVWGLTGGLLGDGLTSLQWRNLFVIFMHLDIVPPQDPPTHASISISTSPMPSGVFTKLESDTQTQWKLKSMF